MLKQKARIRWNLEGDENSKYFHASIRRKYNKCNIRGLNINGLWVEEPRVVNSTVLEHFLKLFGINNNCRPTLRHGFMSATSYNIHRNNVHEYGPVGPSSVRNSNITNSHNGQLENGLNDRNIDNSEETVFNEIEIWEAVKDCGSLKAPGPDGFNMGFYKKGWNTIKYDLIEAIKLFWEKGEISNGCNTSFITLVLKKSDPVSLNARLV
ncbi:uncharacterized protein [Rutidosis leptorrhynchoides]|uniref:uncharacterized protein n=1 Tax=Rutidosis leptorrhynchoides TaxID=125765 RepID=UPI003A99735C